MKTIVLSDELYDRLAAVARPFIDKEPSDVVRWLVETQISTALSKSPLPIDSTLDVRMRTPRERGAVVELDGALIRAETVPDLCEQVMQAFYEKGSWEKILRMEPYKTSAERYLFAKKARHPNGNDFFSPIKVRELYVETHKNYKTSITQLQKLATRLGFSLNYKGN